MGGCFSCVALQLCECAACMACSCCSSIIGASLSQAARFGHFLIILATFGIAIILGKSYPEEINGYNYYTQIDLTGGCDMSYENSCIYRQLIYRASFSLCLLFAILALATGVSDYMNRSLWILKFGFAIGLFIALWWAGNSFFSGWAEVARVVSFFWLLVQGLLSLDFCHDIHDMLMVENDESKMPVVIYLGISFVGVFSAVLGLVYLFLDYTGCNLGMFFTVLTLIMGVLTTALSLLESVGGGLLTPCLMFAYSVFMCWYALLSNPHEGCNPTANSINGTQNGAIIVVAIISAIILMYCVVNGTKILNVFNPSGEGVMKSYTTGGGNATTDRNSELAAVLTGDDAKSGASAYPNKGDSAKAMDSVVTSQPGEPKDAAHRGSTGAGDETTAAAEKSSGTPQERSFFHVLMILVSCYCAMLLTNWGKTNGATASGGGDNTASTESMWLKIVSQWVFLILYCKVLHVKYSNNTP